MLETLLSLLSGAVGGAGVTAFITLYIHNQTRKVSYLRSQIDCFYGPIYFILMNSECLLGNSKDIMDKALEIFKEDCKANDNFAERKMSGSRAVSNNYSNQAIHANNEIFEIISKNFSYVDLNDIEIINKFVKNYSRLQIEFLNEQKLPNQVAFDLPDISILQKTFQERIIEKFNTKKYELRERSWFSKWIC